MGITDGDVNHSTSDKGDKVTSLYPQKWKFIQADCRDWIAPTLQPMN
jgi:hypothetical protein